MTLKRFIRLNRRQFERHPENSNPEHQPDLEQEAFEIVGIAVGALDRR